MASESIKTPDLSHLKAVYTNVAPNGGTYTLQRPASNSPTLLVLGRDVAATGVSIKGLYYIDAWRGVSKFLGDSVLTVTPDSDPTNPSVVIKNTSDSYATLLAIMYNP